LIQNIPLSYCESCKKFCTGNCNTTAGHRVADFAWKRGSSMVSGVIPWISFLDKYNLYWLLLLMHQNVCSWYILDEVYCLFYLGKETKTNKAFFVSMDPYNGSIEIMLEGRRRRGNERNSWRNSCSWRASTQLFLSLWHT
jgi:hypothetical protein